MSRKIYNKERMRDPLIQIFCNNCAESGLVKQSTLEKRRASGIPCIRCGDGRMKPLTKNPLEGITLN